MVSKVGTRQGARERRSRAWVGLDPVNDESFRRRVVDSTQPVLVLFTSTGCAPCELQARRLPALAAELRGEIEVVCCPVDTAPATAAAYEVTVTPTLILFEHGKPLDVHCGVWPLPNIRAWLDVLLPSASIYRSSPPGRTVPKRARTFLRAFFNRKTAVRGCKVASVVAPVLLAVNHCDLLLRAPMSLSVLGHLGLNFLVPFMVSSYSAARTAIENTAADID